MWFFGGNEHRMVDEGKIEASDVCVFEMTERVGGRLMSLRGLGPDGDLTVDAGGYRTVRINGMQYPSRATQKYIHQERLISVSFLIHYWFYTVA